MVLFAGVNGADNERQSVTGNCQLANDVCLHRSIAIMQGDESRGFQLVTANSLKTRFRLEAELRALRGTPRSNENTVSPVHHDQSPSSSTLPAQQATAPTFERTRRIKERHPPTDLVVSVSSLYFRHIHPWFPFLDVQRVFADLGSTDEPSMLHHALFGVALPYSFDSRLDQISSDSFWKYSKRRIFVDVLEEPSYSSLEALTVLTLDLSSMTHSAQVSGPLAVATRLALQLGNTDGLMFRTSTEAERHETLSKRDINFRQRLFWAIYALDSWICITTNSVSTLSHLQVQHFLPFREAVWRDNLPELEEMDLSPTFIFSYQLELLELARMAHKAVMECGDFCNNYEAASSMQQDVQAISSKLDVWIESLPPQLAWNGRDTSLSRIQRANRPAVLMLYAYFHALMMYLNGFIAAPAPGIILPDISAEARQGSQERCLRSSRALAEIVIQAAVHVVDKLGWPFAWSVWVAARFLISQKYTMGSSDPETSANISVFSDFLGRMSRFSQISSTYARLLGQALSELETFDAGGESTILHLISDWRVTTSRLEDHLRPDPMLHVVVSPSLVDGSTNDANMQPLNTLLPVFPDDAWMDISQSSPDSWFRGPLFASSAYQSFNDLRQE
ncbi:positive regulator of purine utilization [Fusarium flagelliforme]|uniref:Positive regulator of purine utilization n=1 Tax=Fusarium flagelliforme TaxID=2675880 RepID=A0A395M7L4_9HYPO|nr:positive regulator of purine utilization [Fusarium flagelliforme]